ncbi:MAG: hypothetical protein JXQ87_17720 [Bacteroidia bacterium]
MKLRIKGNSIRLRLSQSEVKKFGESEICFDKIAFGETSLTYQLHMAEVDSVTAEFGNNTIAVAVPSELGQKWVSDNEMVGFDHNQTFKNGTQLFILIEKDFQCLTERKHEDETDNFANPQAGDVC